MKKIPVKPIWVSDIRAGYGFNGRIDWWNIDVRFEGDLASWHNEKPLPRTVQQFKQYMNWTDADIERMEDDDIQGGHKSIERKFFEFKKENAFFYKTDIPYILNQELDIPKRSNISTVEWDAQSKNGDNKYANTLVGYIFLKDLFGFGYGRAKKFRNKMLAQINEQKIEDFKVQLLKQENIK